MSGGGSGPGGRHIDNGHAFENWTVVGHIADGGFASVYRARYSGLRPADFPPMAALKVIRPLLPEDREQLREEYEASRQLSGHPHIVEVIDLFEAPVPGQERCVILVQELGEHSLSDRLLRSGPLAGEELQELAAAVARAIDGIHTARIIHSDLKPANVLAFPDGWKVADLGEASLITAAATSPGFTIAAIRGVTFWYCPPEYANALMGAGPRPELHRDVDTWAFGVLLHEAATGSLPFDDGAALLSGRATIAPTLPSEVRAVIEACLSPSGVRPPHGSALLQLLSDHDLLPGPPTRAVIRKPSPVVPSPSSSGRSASTLSVPLVVPPVVAPSVAAPSVVVPSVAAPSVAAPSVAAPSVAAPSVVAPPGSAPLSPSLGVSPVAGPSSLAARWRRARWGALAGAVVLLAGALTWGYAIRGPGTSGAGTPGDGGLSAGAESPAGAETAPAGPEAVVPPPTGCINAPAYVSIEKATVLTGIADAFNRSELAGPPGACVRIDIRSHTSGDVACWFLADAGVEGAVGCDPTGEGALAVAADVAAAGPPALYLPASSSFGAKVVKGAPGRITELSPSIATTEVVLAGRQAVFDAVDGCGDPLDSVARLVAALDDTCVTAALGHPLRLGKTNPSVSSSGYGSTLLIAAHSLGGEVTVTGLRTDAEAASVRTRVERAVVHYGSSGPAFLREAEGDVSYVDIALLVRKAVLDFNAGDPSSTVERRADGSLVGATAVPSEPLLAATPHDGVALSDNPVYAASGLDPVVGDGVERFTALLEGEWAQNWFRAYDFGPPASDPSIPGPRVGPVDADTSEVLLAQWAEEERKPVRALFAVDVSTSMTACGEDRLAQVRDSLVASLQQLSANDRVAVVPFSSDGAGNLRFPSAEAVYRSARDPASFAAATSLTIDPTAPNTPLFGAANQAVAALADTADGSTIDVVVLLTDGVNDPTGTGGCTPPPAPPVPGDFLDGLGTFARSHGVRLFAIAYGAGADLEGVTALATATGGSASEASGPEALTEVYRRLITEF